MSGVRDEVRPGAETQARQRIATDPALSVWVTANAGSGKTYVLSRRVLRLLLGGADPGAVLCLTFTKAAAAQMQTRVFEELATWAQAPDDTLTPALADLLGRPPTVTEMALARRLFARAIETPGRLKIQTIHAFCESVLQRFAFEARVPSGFTVLEDDMARALKTQARQDCFARPGNDDLRAALGELSLMLDPDRLARLLDMMIDRRSGLGAWAGNDGKISPGAVRAHLVDVLGITDDRTADAIASDMLNSPHLPRSEWASIGEALEPYRQKATGSTIDQLHAAARADNDADALECYAGIFLTRNGEPRKTLLNGQAQAGEPDLEARIEAERARFLDLHEAHRTAKLLDANSHLAIAADAVIGRYQQVKAERGGLDFADLIEATVKLLQSSSQASWVLYKLDPGLDHILVDEAQDTSPDQWRVIKALSDEFFAGASARLNRRTIFAVGDPKQSIYSFQGADPAGFTEMAGHFRDQVPQDPAPHAAAKAGFQSVELFRSFRTAPAVLEAVDAVFAKDPARNGLIFGETGAVQHQAARERAQGRVEVWDTVPKPETDDTSPWDAPLDARRPDAAETVLAQRIARAIRDSIDSEEILASMRAPAQAGDFLILLRKRKRLATPIIRALKQHDIAVAGADRLALGDAIATMDLMALMRASLMPDDDHALACVLKSPLFGLDDTHLMAIAIDRPGSLADALASHRGDPDIETAASRFEDWAGHARRERPFTFLTRVLGPGGGRKAYRARMGNEADDVLDELADRAIAFERANVASVPGFLAWLERSGGEIKRDLDEGGGAVRVMTVHGAKGLEAPVVFVADTCAPAKSGQRDTLLNVPGATVFSPPDAVVWEPRSAMETTATAAMKATLDASNEEEFHRLLYVAMTRAQDRLIICGAESGQSGRGTGCWYDLVEQGLAERLVEERDGVRVYRPDEPGVPPVALAQSHAKPAEDALPGWTHYPMPALPRARRVAASQLGMDTGATRGNAGMNEDVLRRGTVFHLLMEHVPGLPTAQQLPAAQTLLNAHAGDWPDKTREQMAQRALSIAANPELAVLFGAGSRGEVPVAGRIRRIDDEDLIDVAGRIDRLVVTEDAVIIADYKTGAPPRDGDSTPDAYVAQLAGYAALLRAIHPGKPVSAMLIWLDARDTDAVTHLPPDTLGGYDTVIDSI